MRITIRGYRRNRAASQETEAFTATLVVDGVDAARVLNRGTGGANEYEWASGGAGGPKDAFRQEAEAYGKVHGIAYEADDVYVAYLIQELEVQKKATATRKRFPIVLRLTNGAETVAVVGAMATPQAGDQALASIMEKVGAKGYEALEAQ
jgi:hypothetical protein